LGSVVVGAQVVEPFFGGRSGFGNEGEDGESGVGG
jgi:hypothetical protein